MTEPDPARQRQLAEEYRWGVYDDEEQQEDPFFDAYDLWKDQNDHDDDWD